MKSDTLGLISTQPDGLCTNNFNKATPFTYSNELDSENFELVESHIYESGIFVI